MRKGVHIVSKEEAVYQLYGVVLQIGYDYGGDERHDR